MRPFYFLALLFLASCSLHPNKKDKEFASKQKIIKTIYSKSVTDSFYISVNLPNEYDDQPTRKYPVVYLLDANLYFDIIAAIINKYSEVGLIPPVILVGIGYKDLSAMDSLRNRDDTYPVAIPEYEMNVSGGADKFLLFIDHELIPRIDNLYRTDSTQKVLMGHSLGGYFTSYALCQHLLGKSTNFEYYIAASPSFHYNHYYLLSQLEEATDQIQGKKGLKVYLTYGGLEETDYAEEPGMLKLNEVSGKLSELLSKKTIYKSDIFSNLDHMDTQIPTFIKGLQWMLNNGQ